jgi:LmbE family N-acetylglucosaminyl deacetylase
MTHAPAAAFRPPAPARPAGAPGTHGPLPPARNVLAVVARPGQESVDLGGLLLVFRRAGTRLALLCLTRGEASPLNSTCERLETVRPWELQVAAGLLGVWSIAVADYPDGGLSGYPAEELAERVSREIRRQAPDVLLVIDPAGSPDDAAVAAAACSAAAQARVPVLARSRPDARGGWLAELGPQASAARPVQRSAAAAHASQSEALLHVEHRLDLLHGCERLRWLALADRELRG